MLVKNWMTTDVVTVNVNDSIRDVARLMLKRGLRLLPVEDGGRLVGIVTRSDLKKGAPRGSALTEGEGAGRCSELLVREIMTREPVTIPPEYTVEEAAQLLIEEKISRCPVLDLDGGIVGIITKTDVLRALVSSPGISPIEIVFGVQVEDRPGCINDVISVIHKYRGGLLAVWSSYANAPECYRNVYVRTVNVDPAAMPSLERELREKFKLRFVVDRRQNRRETFDVKG
jgi:acetoin utilization protein AcuB